MVNLNPLSKSTKSGWIYLVFEFLDLDTMVVDMSFSCQILNCLRVDWLPVELRTPMKVKCDSEYLDASDYSWFSVVQVETSFYINTISTYDVLY